jgi:hypothetical protein
LYRRGYPLVEAIDRRQDSFHVHMGNLQKGGAEHRRRRVQHPACAAGDHTGPAHPLAHKDQITLKDISERGLLLSL